MPGLIYSRPTAAFFIACWFGSPAESKVVPRRDYFIESRRRQ